jgi:hypothetical protein
MSVPRGDRFLPRAADGTLATDRARAAMAERRFAVM